MIVYKSYNETKENKKNNTMCTRLSIFSVNMRTLGNLLMYIICALETMSNSCSGYGKMYCNITQYKKGNEEIRNK